MKLVEISGGMEHMNPFSEVQTKLERKAICGRNIPFKPESNAFKGEIHTSPAVKILSFVNLNIIIQCTKNV